ncbi:hypothetical protein CVT26_008074 [Gymnopilus dilepis]|uniref:Uncharacterized protein n=1 Tax=Gymnopilus dilepis TaxID=231916 RepID=A0A409YJN6_9AGAR|nr:hypothetical protein CVT26_008074 [Gymnopilus dilepis]
MFPSCPRFASSSLPVDLAGSQKPPNLKLKGVSFQSCDSSGTLSRAASRLSAAAVAPLSVCLPPILRIHSRALSIMVGHPFCIRAVYTTHCSPAPPGSHLILIIAASIPSSPVMLSPVRCPLSMVPLSCRLTPFSLLSFLFFCSPINILYIPHPIRTLTSSSCIASNCDSSSLFLLLLWFFFSPPFFSSVQSASLYHVPFPSRSVRSHPSPSSHIISYHIIPTTHSHRVPSASTTALRALLLSRTSEYTLHYPILLLMVPYLYTFIPFFLCTIIIIPTLYCPKLLPPSFSYYLFSGPRQARSRRLKLSGSDTLFLNLL